MDVYCCYIYDPTQFICNIECKYRFLRFSIQGIVVFLFNYSWFMVHGWTKKKPHWNSKINENCLTQSYHWSHFFSTGLWINKCWKRKHSENKGVCNTMVLYKNNRRKKTQCVEISAFFCYVSFFLQIFSQHSFEIQFVCKYLMGRWHCCLLVLSLKFTSVSHDDFHLNSRIWWKIETTASRVICIIDNVFALDACFQQLLSQISIDEIKKNVGSYSYSNWWSAFLAMLITFMNIFRNIFFSVFWPVLLTKLTNIKYKKHTFCSISSVAIIFSSTFYSTYFVVVDDDHTVWPGVTV